MPLSSDLTDPRRRIVLFMTALAATVVLLIVYLPLLAGRAQAAFAPLPVAAVTASSIESAGTPASAAVDGNPNTRWSSKFSDPQWIQLDLGAPATLGSVTLNWEAAYARAFQVQISNDAATWTTVYATTTGTGGVQTLNISGTGRYLRIYGTARAGGFGYSLYEIGVYGIVGGPGCQAGNSALTRPALASSVENAGHPAAAAFDGDLATRWSSQFSDPQWIQVDLGAQRSVCELTLSWEAAYAKGFQIQISADGQTWTTIYATTAGTGGTQLISLDATGRYVRMYGTVRGTGYGYSLREFAVKTRLSYDPPPTPTRTTQPPIGDPVPSPPTATTQPPIGDPAPPTPTTQAPLG
jgi:beta-glucosidase